MGKSSDIEVWGGTAAILGHEERLSKYTSVLIVHVCSRTCMYVIIQGSKAKCPFACEVAGSSRVFHLIPSTFWVSPFGHTRS